MPREQPKKWQKDTHTHTHTHTHTQGNRYHSEEKDGLGHSGSAGLQTRVPVHSGCWSRASQAGGLNSGNGFLAVVAAGKSKGQRHIGGLVRPCSWFMGGPLLAESSHGARDQEAPWGLFQRALVLFMRAPPSWPHHLPTETPTLGEEVSVFEFCRAVSFQFAAPGVLILTPFI